MRSHSPTASPRAPAERAPRLRPLGVGVALFLVALFLVAGFKTWRDLNVVERREAELEASIAETRGEIGELEGRLERIEHDPAVLERLAREELAMTYPDELVIILPSVAPPAGVVPPVERPAPPRPGSEPPGTEAARPAGR